MTPLGAVEVVSRTTTMVLVPPGLTPDGSSRGDSPLRQVASVGSCQRATEKARMSGTSVANKNSSTLNKAS